MDTTRWNRMKDLFDAALAVAPEQRAGRVAEWCDGDESLREELEAMLHAADADDGFLLPPDRDVFEQCLGCGSESYPPGTRVGAWAITSHLATGGMGDVYVGCRADDAFDKVVAIKLIRGNILGANAADRFRRERQVLANLEHPNITRLLDGGTMDDGRPFLVMEFIEGEPIDEYCDRHALTLHERLLLFQTVCAAVAHAHRSLVVHRDLKPRNILVRADGSVMLLDFGIARLIEDEDDSSMFDRGGRTVTRHRILTPEYASPEQIRGEAASTSNDVYALGVVLHELLTGRRPHDLDGLPSYEAERVVCEEDPLAPSTVLTRLWKRRSGESGAADDAELQRRRRQLAGDLDVVVLTALHRDAAQRYASVEQLSDDIQRYLDDLPIRASRAPWPVRVRRVMRRHRPAVIAGTAVSLALVLAVVGLVFGIVQARGSADAAVRERNAAESARAVSQDVLSVFEQSLASANPYRRGHRVTVLEMLADAEDMIRSDATIRPVVEAGVRLAMARTYVNLMRWDDVSRQASRALTLYDQMDRAVVDQQLVAECLSVLGRARTHLKDRSAVALQRRGLKIRTALLSPDDPLVAESVGNLAFALWSSDDGSRRFDEAERLYREALDHYQRINMSDCRDAARFTMSLGFMYAVQGRVEDAERCFVESLALYDGLETEDMYEFATLNRYASILEGQGRCDEAIVLMERYRSMLPEALNTRQRCMSSWMLARLQRCDGDLDAAERELCRALSTECAFFAAVVPNRPADLLLHASRLGDELDDRQLIQEVDAALAVLRDVVGDTDLLADRHEALARHFDAAGDAEFARDLMIECVALLLERHEAFDDVVRDAATYRDALVSRAAR